MNELLTGGWKGNTEDEMLILVADLGATLMILLAEEDLVNPI